MNGNDVNLEAWAITIAMGVLAFFVFVIATAFRKNPEDETGDEYPDYRKCVGCKAHADGVTQNLRFFCDECATEFGIKLFPIHHGKK